MKLTLALLALALLVLFITGCEAPIWANFEIFVLADGEIVGGPHYCISWERRVAVFYCWQPESVEKITLEPGQVLQVWVVNQVMP